MSRSTLFIQSGGRASARLALDALLEGSGSSHPVICVRHPWSVLPDLARIGDDVEELTVGSDLASLLALRRRLRGQRFSTVAALFDGGRGLRRLKLLAITLGGRSLLVFDERGRSFRWGEIGPLAAHLSRRLRAWLGRLAPLRLLTAAVRSLGAEGLRATARRARRHLRRPSRRPPIPVRLRRDVAPLAFPVADAPRVSIVVPVRDRWTYTYNCLRSILERTTDVAYEVIVVDDGSTDRTPDVLTRVANLHVVHVQRGRGFVAACNLGAARARGEAIAFLNNDVLVCPDWLPAMLRVLDTDDACGAVGAKLLAPSGRLLEAGGIVWRDGSAWNCGRGERADRPEHNYVREVDYASAAALLVRARAFRQVGGFDERYSPGYWEDTDLCFALREHGWRTVYQPAATVVHFEGVSAGRTPRRGMKRFQEINRPKFEAKWRHRLAEQPERDPEDLFVARDRNRGRRLLVVDQHVPTWDRDAGSFFMRRLLETLCRWGYRVVFWPADRARLTAYSEPLQQLGVEVAYGDATLHDFAATHAGRFDAVVGHRWHIVAPHLDAFPALAPRFLFVAPDIESLREERRIAAEGDAPGGLEAVRATERRVLAACDRATVHSPAEQRLLRARGGGPPVDLIPLPVAAGEATAAPFESRSDLLFVGSSHPPNVDALRFYREEIEPLMARLLPGVRMNAVGEVCDALGTASCAGGTLLLHGHVPSLESHFETARIFLAPLRYGAGVKGKILEAMRAGLPVVTTPAGADGIPLVDGESALIAATARALADAAARLYNDCQLWQSLRRNARRVIEEHYSSAGFEAAVRSTLEALWTVEGPPTVRWREPG